MKISHRVNPNWVRPSAPIDAAYQREIDLTLHRAAKKAHRQAVTDLRIAERSLRRRDDRGRREALAAAKSAVLARLAELEAIERLMQQAPAATTHRVRAINPNPSKL